MNILMISKDKWDALTEGERGCVWSYMTEVGPITLGRLAEDWLYEEWTGSKALVDEFLYDRRHGKAKGFSKCLLAHLNAK